MFDQFNRSSEQEDILRRAKLRTDVRATLGVVVPRAISGDIYDVQNAKPEGYDGEVTDMLIREAHAGMVGSFTPEQAKWFAAGAVAQALVSSRQRTEDRH